MLATVMGQHPAPLPAEEVWLHHSVTIAPDLDDGRLFSHTQLVPGRDPVVARPVVILVGSGTPPA
jgi:hypothetical protein